MDEIYDVVIVGGGLSGLYFLYKLLQIRPDWKILLLEKEDRLGGRIWTVYDDQGNPLYEKGARRVMKHHFKMLKLIQKMNLELLDTHIDNYADNNLVNESYAKDDREYYYIKNGFNSIIDALYNKIDKSIIKTSCYVNNISYFKNYKLSLSENNINLNMQSKILIIATPSETFEKWNIGKNLTYLTNSVSSIPITKINAYNTTKSFNNFNNFKITVGKDNLIIHSSLYNNNWFVPIFAKEQLAIEWNELYKASKDKCKIKIINNTKKYLDNINITDFDLKFWDHGYHAWNSEYLFKKHGHQLNPMNNLCIIGESFSHQEKSIFKYNAWCENALKVCDYVYTFFDPYFSSLNIINYDICFLYDQENTKSCTSNALSTILTNLQPFYIYPISRLYIYYNTRMLMNTTHLDSGSDILKALEAIKTYGICPEYNWPFNNQNLLISPNKECYEYAKKYLIDFKHCKFQITQSNWINKISYYLSNNILLLCNVEIEENVTIHSNSIIPSIKFKDQNTYIHDILIIGIINTEKKIVCLNSYGQEATYFFITFDQINNLNPIDDEIFAITATYLNNIVDENNYNAILEFYKKPFINFKTIFYESLVQIIDYKKIFDHVIIGNGFTAYYLAYRLKNKFPHDSILILSNYKFYHENFEMDVDGLESINNVLIENSLILNLLKELNINCDDVKQENYKIPNYEICRDIFDICIANDDSNLEILFKLFSNPKICKLYKKSINDCLLKNINLSSNLPMNEMSPLYYYFLNNYLHKIVNLDKIFDSLLDQMLIGFEHMELGDFLNMNISKYSILFNVEITELLKNNEQLLFQQKSRNKKLPKCNQIRINYKHVYFCDLQAERTNSFLFNTFVYDTKIYLYLSQPIEYFNNFYHNEWGNIIFINNNTILSLYPNNVFFNKIENLLSIKFFNNLIYKINVFPGLNNFINNHLPLANIQIDCFKLFRCDNIKQQKIVGNDNFDTFYDRLLYQFNLDSNDHYLNSNYSLAPLSLDGNIDLINRFIEKFKNYL